MFANFGYWADVRAVLARNEVAQKAPPFLANKWGSQPFTWLAPSLKLTLQFWDHIHGADADLTVPGPFPFPAPVTNPNFFGGTKVSLSGGFQLTWPDGFLAGTAGDSLAKQSIIFEIGLPIYQSLKGPQPEEDWELGLSWYWRF